MSAVVDFIAEAGNLRKPSIATSPSEDLFLSSPIGPVDIAVDGDLTGVAAETCSRPAAVVEGVNKGEIWPGESASNRGGELFAGERCLQLCKELIKLGFDHASVATLVGKCLDAERVGASSPSSVGDVSSSVDGSDGASIATSVTRSSVRRMEYHRRGEDMANKPGCCYLRLVRCARRAVVFNKLGVSPTLSALCALDQSDLAIRDFSKLVVEGSGVSYHIAWKSGRNSHRTFAAAMGATDRAFPGMIPSGWLNGSCDGEPVPIVARFGGTSGSCHRSLLPSMKLTPDSSVPVWKSAEALSRVLVPRPAVGAGLADTVHDLPSFQTLLQSSGTMVAEFVMRESTETWYVCVPPCTSIELMGTRFFTRVGSAVLKCVGFSLARRWDQFPGCEFLAEDESRYNLWEDLFAFNRTAMMGGANVNVFRLPGVVEPSPNAEGGLIRWDVGGGEVTKFTPVSGVGVSLQLLPYSDDVGLTASVTYAGSCGMRLTDPSVRVSVWASRLGVEVAGEGSVMVRY